MYGPLHCVTKGGGKGKGGGYCSFLILFQTIQQCMKGMMGGNAGVENNSFANPLPLFGFEQLAHWLSVTFTNSEHVM